MEKVGNEIHLNATEASAGSKEGVVRWILAIGLVLGVLAMSAIWITGAWSHSETSETARLQADSNISASATTLDETGSDNLTMSGEHEMKDGMEVVDN
ncbi:MAG: hypothetical protein H6918_09960 [Sphingomonadaceae bacterium]|nr:hypothetical protein [Sphingomonadaceae bacterium]